MRVVVALGGNALQPREDAGTIAEQRATIREAAEEIASLAAQGHEPIVTHGNGPQVGRLLMVEESLPATFPPYPLDVLVAETQGHLGYLIQQEIAAALRRRRVERAVVTALTQTIVDPADPAFLRPTKPVGPYLDDAAAAEARGRGRTLAPAPGGGWRRLVPSPEPLGVVEAPVLRALLAEAVLPIVAGGGGIPVVREGNATRGVEAVVDKDLTAAVLARELSADALLIVTNVEGVIRDHGTPDARVLRRLSVADARAGVERGEYPPGSMGPKIRAAVKAVEAGARAVIGPLGRMGALLDGSAGTEVMD